MVSLARKLTDLSGEVFVALLDHCLELFMFLGHDGTVELDAKTAKLDEQTHRFAQRFNVCCVVLWPLVMRQKRLADLHRTLVHHCIIKAERKEAISLSVSLHLDVCVS